MHCTRGRLRCRRALAPCVARLWPVYRSRCAAAAQVCSRERRHASAAVTRRTPSSRARRLVSRDTLAQIRTRSDEGFAKTSPPRRRDQPWIHFATTHPRASTCGIPRGSRRREASQPCRLAFRRAVLRRFVRLELFDMGQAAGMLAWPHSGFPVKRAVRVFENDRAFATWLARDEAPARSAIALDGSSTHPD